MHCRHAVFLLLIVSALLAAGCGSDDNPPNACDACVTPPAPTCDGDTLRTYVAFGVCESGRCVYDEAASTRCTHGCANNQCVSAPTDPPVDPCEDVVCPQPAPRCDGEVAVVATATPTCDDGVCRGGATSRSDCAARGEVCVDGACQPSLCAEARCDTPPAARCDGPEAITYVRNGVCDPSTGRCEYVERRTTCDAPGATCDDGACVTTPLCEGVTCPGQASGTCDGDVATQESAPRCEPATGTCVRDTTTDNCAERGERCTDGVCETVDPCASVICDTPPFPFCADGIAFVYLSPGRCSEVTGRCQYDAEATVCATLGEICSDGACAPDPCADATCDAPPPNRCDNLSRLRVFPSEGVCVAGFCDYAPELIVCNDDAPGTECRDAMCRPSCAILDCSEVPPPVCEGDTLVTRVGPGTCSSGTCIYGTFEESCAARDEICREGACRDQCFGVACETPPAGFCVDDTAFAYSSPGTCGTVDGTCHYTTRATNCALTDEVCVAGICAQDPCDVLVCDTPPAPRCEGEVAVIPFGTGVCEDGACTFPERSEPCETDGLRCVDGGCRDACYGVACDDLPAPRCEDDVAVAYGPDAGVCDPATATCAYVPTFENCALSDEICLDGHCVGDPCEDVACLTPPPATCDGNVVRSFLAVGVCASGVCTYTPVENSCDNVPGSTCVDGACVRPCDGIVCDAPPGPVCFDDISVGYIGPGVCDDGTGECVYSADPVNCALSEDICTGGLCVPDPCVGFVCADPPPPTCDGTTRVVYDQVGTCDLGACIYAEGRVNCAGFDAICVDGQCISGDPCFNVVCESPPPPRCVGDLARVPTDEGVCVDGGCVYPEATLDCAAIGELCDDGACVPYGSCDLLECDDAPPDTCVGDLYVSYEAEGACVGGRCVYAEREVVACADLDAQCLDGACVPLDPCPLVCTTPPGPFCLDAVRVLPLSPGTCESAACVYSDALLTDCTTHDQVCIDGECVDDPCDTLSCDTPPEPFCDGDVRVITVGPGVCEQGACTYPVTSPLACVTLDAQCIDGECIPIPDCNIDGCPRPPSSCVGTRAQSFSGQGLCDPTRGTCDYTDVLTETECFALGRACMNGTCVNLAAVHPDEIRINEFMVRAGADGGQWIELVNATDVARSVGGMVLRNGAGETIVIPGSTSIAPGGFYLLGDSAHGVPAGVDFTWTSIDDFSIGTDADVLELVLGDQIIDRVAYDRLNWPLDDGWPVATGATVQLTPQGLVERSALRPYWCEGVATYAAGARGTPRAPNRTCP